jgi:hypothetical protein
MMRLGRRSERCAWVGCALHGNAVVELVNGRSVRLCTTTHLPAVQSAQVGRLKAA